MLSPFYKKNNFKTRNYVSYITTNTWLLSIFNLKLIIILKSISIYIFLIYANAYMVQWISVVPVCLIWKELDSIL